MRRPLIAFAALCLAGGVVTVPVVGASPAHAAAYPYNDCLVLFHGLDLQTATMPQLEAGMASGTFTSRELTQRYLDRISAYDLGAVKINAIRTLTDDVLAQADAADALRASGVTGPLLGIPILLKDNIGTTDADTTAGSIALAGNRPPKDADLVAQLRAAHAVILAKSNLSEFANWMAEGMPNGFSSLGGQVVAPYDQGDPSGSSSGSGAGGTLAFAAGTFGSETSGSILSPSTVNSMVGIKPTVGLVSRVGVIPLANSYDTAGPIARTVTDAATELSAVSAPDPTDAVNMEAAGAPTAAQDFTKALVPGALKGAHIGYSTADEPTDAAAAALWDAARAALTAQGATLVETDTLANSSPVSLTSIAGIADEFHYGINNYLATEAGPVGDGTTGGGRVALLTDDLTGIIAYNQQNSAKIPYGQSLLLASEGQPGLTLNSPTSTATITDSRTVIDMTLGTTLDAYVAPDAAYAGPGAAAGYPSITVPTGYTTATVGSTPHGIQFLGAPFTEAKLIGLGYAFEQATKDRVPATVDDPAITQTFCAAAAPAAPAVAAPAAPATPTAAAAPTSAALADTGLPPWTAAAPVALVAAAALRRRGRRAVRARDGL